MGEVVAEGDSKWRRPRICDGAGMATRLGDRERTRGTEMEGLKRQGADAKPEVHARKARKAPTSRWPFVARTRLAARPVDHCDTAVATWPGLPAKASTPAACKRLDGLHWPSALGAVAKLKTFHSQQFSEDSATNCPIRVYNKVFILRKGLLNPAECQAPTALVTCPLAHGHTDGSPCPAGLQHCARKLSCHSQRSWRASQPLGAKPALGER